ncbi:MAG: dimethylarginine dimethylaminohydrolase [Caulobacteraceae bacterium]|nr:dimethylarginine dimethylaminohydrolase [Caulobacteraceae bacterium]
MNVHRFDRAIVRRPSRAVVDGLRSGSRAPDFERIVAEHQGYVGALREAGLSVDVLPALEGFADSLFVEDPALVLGGCAFLLRPGAPSRLGEVDAIRPALGRHFERIVALPPAGFVDGGDVLVAGKTVFIGLSARTDQPGATALGMALAEVGAGAIVVRPPSGQLHLKSACSLIDDETIFATRRLIDAEIFAGMKVIPAVEGEELGANALRLNDVLLVGSGFPRTADLLAGLGYGVVTVDVTEVGKLDAGLSCMSLRWLADRGSGPKTTPREKGEKGSE